MKRTLLPALAIALLLSSCAKRRVTQPRLRIGAEETGMASWYGRPYHGRPSSSGEIYDMEQLTAAHRTLPFGTVVRVRNLDNGLTVDVRINDRGPFARDRIIDLSRAAARQIRMLGPGTARVRLRIVALPGFIGPPNSICEGFGRRGGGGAEGFGGVNGSVKVCVASTSMLVG